MKTIYILLIIVLPICSFGQGNNDEFHSPNIPVTITNTMDSIYPNVNIQNVWTDNQRRYFNYEFKIDYTNYHATFDTLGNWKRTYRNFNADTIPAICIELLEKEKQKLDKNYRLDRHLFEYNGNYPDGYYEFVYSKPLGLTIEGDTTLTISKIRINLNCEIVK